MQQDRLKEHLELYLNKKNEFLNLGTIHCFETFHFLLNADNTMKQCIILGFLKR